jgi:hypothetical protein
MTELPTYRSHKTVRAAPIIGILEGRTPSDPLAQRVYLETHYGTVEAPANIFARGRPTLGVDYVVIYDDGYVSWSPKKPFEEGYTALDRAGIAADAPERERAEGLDFGRAIRLLKRGQRVARDGWNGKGMWVEMSFGDGRLFLPHVMLRTVDGKIVPWNASQTDMLADDWTLVDDALTPAADPGAAGGSTHAAGEEVGHGREQHST